MWGFVVVQVGEGGSGSKAEAGENHERLATGSPDANRVTNSQLRAEKDQNVNCGRGGQRGHCVWSLALGSQGGWRVVSRRTRKLVVAAQATLGTDRK